MRRGTGQRGEADSWSFTAEPVSATDLVFFSIPPYLSLFSYNCVLANAVTEEPAALVQVRCFPTFEKKPSDDN